MTTNVYLVGFMGAGKTEVGRRLAGLAGWRFVDLDLEIEKRAGMPVPEIFRQLGEPQFRAMERAELRMASALARTVVALGGGAFCAAENREVVAASGISVWLDAPLDAMLERCSGDAASRPLLSSREEMRALFERRRPSYELASLKIETAGLGADAVARRILDLLPDISAVPDRPPA
jgi:shikimate kinase